MRVSLGQVQQGNAALLALQPSQPASSTATSVYDLPVPQVQAFDLSNLNLVPDSSASPSSSAWDQFIGTVMFFAPQVITYVAIGIGVLVVISLVRR